MFASYVSPRIVQELIRRPELAQLGGQQKVVSTLFSDIKGFTSYCEHHSPSEVVHVLNQYLGAMTDVAFYWEGTLDKFVGDAVMVYWGAPLPQEDHAERAIRCALHMHDRLMQLHQQWREEKVDPFEIGIGINTGEAIVGNMGAEGKKMDYTVIGDSVNVAARAESLTRKLQVPLVITEETYNQVSQMLEVREDDATPIRGTISQRTKNKKIGRIRLVSFKGVEVKGKGAGINVFGVAAIPRKEDGLL